MRVFVARSDCGPTHAPGLARWARGWWLPLALALALSACAAPISLTRVDPREVHRELTRNVLSAGELSPFSQIVVNRADLHGQFADDPDGVLRRLHGELGADGRLTKDPRLALTLKGGVTSVAGMTPGSPLLTVLAPLPLAPGVTDHSIIAVLGEGPLGERTDGVVASSSAHLDGMASERVVTSGHSVQSNPEAIEGVRRILLEYVPRP